MAELGDDPDAERLAAAMAGDRAAFAELLRLHYDRIHGLAWQLTGSRADADDIAQDVCCTLVEKLSGFRGEARFTTWMCGIVVNACRDLRRRRRSFSGLTDRLAVLAGLARPPDGRDAYDSIWLESAIARLKPAYRDAAVLVAGQQLTHAEAARILGVAESTVSWRMHEVRRLLGAEAGGGQAAD
ncbi:MAG: polymerase sigma-70 factor, subfamily [Sphingomonadales bacterium]|jgi:RNA polymerase sigma factor (sigma-70 family)|nr:polymerase sigma-70 factor, subfamily [Sphingomonadales bacterium]